tara:strand:+ start:1744 stop:1941 length:198 start_codon:yes stop_codon:yes gene_type:complete
MKKVFLDADGHCINIGDWDYRKQVNELGETVTTNPIPEGVTESYAEVVTGWDGGIYLSTDPRKDG